MLQWRSKHAVLLLLLVLAVLLVSVGGDLVGIDQFNW